MENLLIESTHFQVNFILGPCDLYVWVADYIPPEVWRKWGLYVLQMRDGFCQVMTQISLNTGANTNATVLLAALKPPSHKGFNGIQPTMVIGSVGERGLNQMEVFSNELSTHSVISSRQMH